MDGVAGKARKSRESRHEDVVGESRVSEHYATARGIFERREYLDNSHRDVI